MKVTSAQASKMLKKLQIEYNDLLRLEDKTSTFLAAVGEDVESVRPAYSYEETREKATKLASDIRKIKHAINIFNTVTVLPGFNMTIDEALVFIPQLTAKIGRLNGMKSVLPKERQEIYGRSSTNLIDYKYANYDIAKAESDFYQANDTLARVQLALDSVNNSELFEIDI